MNRCVLSLNSKSKEWNSIWLLTVAVKSRRCPRKSVFQAGKAMRDSNLDQVFQ